MKICSKCQIEQLENEFNKNKNQKSGLHVWCKNCLKQYRQRHKAKMKQYNKQYNLNHKEKIKQLSKQYNQTHKEERKQYRQDHKKDKNQRDKQRYASNIQFYLICRLRCRLREALKNNRKVGSAVRDLGCSIPELIVHLESQFTKGMTWENKGKWHIDHIKPLASFDLTDRAQLLEACSYENLQPLWAKDNLSKSDK